MKILSLILLTFLTGCSALSGMATDAALGAVTGKDKGIEATAQIGQENTKSGVIAAKKDNSVRTDEVEGNLSVDNSVTVNIPWWGFIGALFIVGIVGLLTEPSDRVTRLFKKEK